MNPDKNRKDSTSNPSEKFETDVQKLVRRHLEDPNHTITEEEIRNLRVGITDLPDESHSVNPDV